MIRGRGSGRLAAISSPVQPGIRISSKSRSGCRRPASSMVSTPVSASPTISISVWEASNWRSRARAGASSSAITTRIAGPSPNLGRHRAWDSQPDPRPPIARSPTQLSQIAIIPGESLGDIAQAMPGRTSQRKSRGETGPIVRHFDQQKLALDRRAQFDQPSTGCQRSSVPHRILDEGLDAHGGNRDLGGSGVQTDLCPQTVTEAGPFHAQICVYKLCFLIQPHPLAFGFAQRVPKDLCQLLDGLIRERGIGRNEAGDGVERVKQEMRIDLGPQGLEFCAARQNQKLPLTLLLALLQLAEANVLKNDGKCPAEGIEQVLIVAHKRYAGGTRLDHGPSEIPQSCCHRVASALWGGIGAEVHLGGRLKNPRETTLRKGTQVPFRRGQLEFVHEEQFGFGRGVTPA